MDRESLDRMTWKQVSMYPHKMKKHLLSIFLFVPYCWLEPEKLKPRKHFFALVRKLSHVFKIFFWLWEC